VAAADAVDVAVAAAAVAAEAAEIQEIAAGAGKVLASPLTPPLAT